MSFLTSISSESKPTGAVVPARLPLAEKGELKLAVAIGAKDGVVEFAKRLFSLETLRAQGEDIKTGIIVSEAGLIVGFILGGPITAIGTMATAVAAWGGYKIATLAYATGAEGARLSEELLKITNAKVIKESEVRTFTKDLTVASIGIGTLFIPIPGLRRNSVIPKTHIGQKGGVGPALLMEGKFERAHNVPPESPIRFQLNSNPLISMLEKFADKHGIKVNTVEEIAQRLGIERETLRSLRSGLGYSKELVDSACQFFNSHAPPGKKLLREEFTFLERPPNETRSGISPNTGREPTWTENYQKSGDFVKFRIAELYSILVKAEVLPANLPLTEVRTKLFGHYRGGINDKVPGAVARNFDEKLNEGIVNLKKNNPNADWTTILPKVRKISEELVSHRDKVAPKKLPIVKALELPSDLMTLIPDELQVRIKQHLEHCTGPNVSQQTKNQSYAILETTIHKFQALPEATAARLKVELYKTLTVLDSGLDVARVKVALARARLPKDVQDFDGVPNVAKFQWSTSPHRTTQLTIESIVSKSGNPVATEMETSFLVSEMNKLPKDAHEAFRRVFSLDNKKIHPTADSAAPSVESKAVTSEPNLVKDPVIERGAKFLAWFKKHFPNTQMVKTDIKVIASTLGVDANDLVRSIQKLDPAALRTVSKNLVESLSTRPKALKELPEFLKNPELKQH